MPVSLNKARYKTCLGGALAVLVLIGLALVRSPDVWAQTLDKTPEVGKSSGPLVLSPPTDIKPAGPARTKDRTTEATPAPSKVDQGAILPAGVSGGKIQVDNLENIDPDTAGVLTQEQGGFGVDMWQQTSRVLVNAFLPKLPVEASSPAMRSLMRRLLLTAATPPEVSAKGKTDKPGSLIAERVRMLAAMGDFVGVSNLLNVTPSHQTNAELLRIEVDARFLANDIARACGLAASQIAEQIEPYWQKTFIFCQALAGEHEKAGLGLDLLREVGVEDAVFFSLIESFGGGPAANIESLPAPDPLHLAMARAGKAALPADVILSGRPGVLRTIAVSPNAPMAIRLEAAERAEVAGALPVDTLRQLYTSVDFSKEDLESPLTRAGAYEGAMSRALLYRTALLQTIPTAQAETMNRALELARGAGRYASTVRAFLPVLNRIPPSSELNWFAPEAIRALLVGGNPESALTWYQLLRATASSGGEAEKRFQGLMPLMRMAGFPGGDDWGPDNLVQWWGLIKAEPGARRQARTLFTLMDVFYGPISSDVWIPLTLDAGTSEAVSLPPLSLMRRLDTASRRAQVGETVMLSLAVLGKGGVAEASPEALDQVLRALWQIGLEKDARALALEAMIAAGF